jgi:S-adenosylmethionine hydrolase
MPRQWSLLTVIVVGFSFAACAHAPRPVIGLLTDYGTQDSYVAELKGIIYKVEPGARVADLTHQVPSFDVREGSYLLGRAIRQFPAGSLFVAVVDPGVGTPRKAVAVRTATGKTLVGPDNGLFSRACAEEGPCVAHELRERRYWRDPNTSTTFHGRDIFGPVAGHLSRGVALEALGPRVPELVALPTTAAAREGQAIVGEVVHVDVYGNCSTNIPAAFVEGGKAYAVGGRVFPRAETYADVSVGEPVLVIDSEGRVELALNQGHLGSALGWKAGTALRLTPAP